jgi:glycine/D-amino acid oxidase-like deaminating enzyme
MPDTFDVAVIGAGIVGTACALELAAAGLAVCVLEGDVVGSGATAAGMGHIVVMDDSEAQLRLTRYSQQLWDALAQDAPDRHEYTRCGTLWVATDDEETAEVHRKHALYAAHSIASEIIGERTLYSLEPHLKPGLAGGLLVPGDSVVYPPRSAAILLEQAAARGAVLRHGTAVAVQEDGVRLASGDVVRAGAVLLANGARCVDLLPELPVRPKKGHLVITDRYPGYLRHQLVEVGYVKNAHAGGGDSVSFNVQPRGTGQLLIGSSRQLDVATRDIDQHILSRMLARAIEYLPGLGQLSCIRAWTGLRAATSDGLPLIGPHPERPGVWLATGHEGLGITTAPGTAHLLAAQFLGRAPEIPVEPYLPSRVLKGVAHV